MIDLAASPWKEVLIFALGCLVASIAFFAKRRIEGKGQAELLDRRAKVLAVHKSMKEEGLSLADLNRVEDELTRRREIEDQVVAEVANLAAEGPAPGETQAEMNVLAAADLAVAEAMLEKTLVEARMHCSDVPEALEEAQAAWRVYAEKEASYLASTFEGGSMYGMIVKTELERLSVVRIADLRKHLEWLRSL